MPRAGRSILPEILLCASVAGWPLLFAVPAILSMESRFVSVPFRAAVLVVAVLAILLRRQKWPAGTGSALFAFGLFWGLYTSRLMVDAAFGYAMRLSPGEYFAYALGTGMLPALALGVFLDRIQLGRTLMWTLGLATAGGAAVLWLAVTNLEMGLAQLALLRGEIDAMDTISVGHLGVTLMLLSLYVLVRRESFGVAARAAAAGSLVIGLLNVALGGSKGPIIALALCLPLLFHLAFNRTYTRVTLRGFLFAVATVAAGAVLVQQASRVTALSRFEAALSGADSSVDVRLELISGAWRLFLDNPVLGAGIEPLGHYPHNVVVEAFASIGLFGGLAFFFLTAASGVAALRLVLRRSPAAWTGVLLIQYSVGDLFSNSLYMSATSWALKLLVIVQNAEELTRSATGASRSRDPGVSLVQQGGLS